MCDIYTKNEHSLSQFLVIITGSMSNDSGVMEHITFPSLSSASFASKRCTGLILVISTRTSSIAGMVLWNASEFLSKKVTEQSYGKSALPWNRQNSYPVAKHLAWRDYRPLQRRTQVHEGEHNAPPPWRSSQEGGPTETHSDSGNSAGNCIATSKSIR